MALKFIAANSEPTYIVLSTEFVEGVDLKIVVKGEAGAVCTAQIRGQIENA